MPVGSISFDMFTAYKENLCAVVENIFLNKLVFFSLTSMGILQ